VLELLAAAVEVVRAEGRGANASSKGVRPAAGGAHCTLLLLAPAAVGCVVLLHTPPRRTRLSDSPPLQPHAVHSVDVHTRLTGVAVRRGSLSAFRGNGETRRAAQWGGHVRGRVC
jgi:hypothetical protein